MYIATLKVLNQKITSKGKTILDAISALDVKNPRGRAILTITNGEKTKDRIIMPVQLQRTFNSQGITRSINLKNLSLTFQGL